MSAHSNACGARHESGLVCDMPGEHNTHPQTDRYDRRYVYHYANETPCTRLAWHEPCGDLRNGGTGGFPGATLYAPPGVVAGIPNWTRDQFARKAGR